MLSGRGLCDELIARPERSYRLWCVVVCDLETSRMRRPWPALGRSATAPPPQKRSICYWCMSIGLLRKCNNINGGLWSFEFSSFIISEHFFDTRVPFDLMRQGFPTFLWQRTVQSVVCWSVGRAWKNSDKWHTCFKQLWNFLNFFTRFANLVAGRLMQPGGLHAARGLRGGDPRHTLLCVSVSALLCFQWPTEYIYMTECVAADHGDRAV